MFTKNIKVIASSALILGSSLFLLMIIFGVSSGANAAVSGSDVLENSYLLCHDGIDNDNNGTTDMGDRNCSNFATEPFTPATPVVENSYALCHDGIDNDNNGTTDMGDRNCANFTTAPATTTDTTLTVVENSYALCHDGIDNDNNGTTDMGDRNCANFATAPATTTDTTNVVVENSYALCHDGIDNDNNGTTDMGDRNCANFATLPNQDSGSGASVTLENTYDLCHDGIDNDNNGTTDMGDRNCANFATAPATTTPQNPTSLSNGGGGSSSGSYLPGFGGSVLGAQTGGEVLGAAIDTESTSTQCNNLFKTFMRKGYKNDKDEVIKLQNFLNTELSLKLPVTGFFGALTDNAVREFQLKKANIVLVPWIKAGLMKTVASTGYFYRTTQFAANQVLCPNTVVDAPILK